MQSSERRDIGRSEHRGRRGRAKQVVDRQAAKSQEDRAGQERANDLETELKRADERRTVQLHRENAVLWREHFIRMARNHHDIAAEYAAKADALNGDDAA